MLDKLKKSNDKGFTIIEIMIVLAIAGLILLIVFLAVPALQRNSRNTQRNTDIGSLVGAFNEFVNNNNGTVPNASCSGATPCAWLRNARAGIYGGGSNTWTAANYIYSYSAVAQALNPAANVNNVWTYNFETCGGANNNAGVAGTSINNVAFIYYVETGGGGTNEECRTAG